MKKTLAWTGLAVLGAASALTASAVTIDGTITTGEWAGATEYTIGTSPGGASVGTAYLRADQNYVYGAFDITGWTAAMGAASHGNLLGFSVEKGPGNYPVGNWISFSQSSAGAGTLAGYSGPMNGLDSAFALNNVVQGSIPGTLQAMDSFATGHRVWEVQMPLSSFGGLNVGDILNVVGGINFDSKQHWYPAAFGAAPYGSMDQANYGHITVEAGASVPDGGLTLVLLGSALTGLAALRRKLSV